MTTGERRSDATAPAPNGRSTSTAHSGHRAANDGRHEQPIRGGLAVDDAAFSETVDAVAESGGTELAAEQIPTAEHYPFAPRTLTRAMARRAAQLGLQLPKPRLRGMIHLATFPVVLITGLLLVAFGETLAIRLACTVFVATASLLFGISALYHRGTWSPQHAIILRRFDHANIFLIIAGTYTPLAISLLQPRDAATLLAICWGGAAVGVLFRLFWTGAPRWLYVPAYIALGWVAIFYMPQMLAGGGWAVVSLLVAGGLAYTAGAMVYAVKRPDPSPAWFGYHEIFHVGTVAGFACHFAAVALSIS
ncbi:PAQR family membrane homeostasis protein TrhA [Brachybacterium muris]|uniref:PAQR family membrane homeostasis protein TrhA n=1 Tax=Brachybacterium muris TaxID=219301 RepID=UPI00195A8026|nr:hemolysin III family protein [Brachybacterium muris]MCT2295854.1 hemolysin III family protein [Brachybacterium muris]